MVLAGITLLLASVQVVAYFYYKQVSPSSLSTAEQSCPDLASSAGFNVQIDYGNATAVWNNTTSIWGNWNFYNYTWRLTGGNMEAQFYPAYSEHLVTAINGVRANGSSSWNIWQYCQSGAKWIHSGVGADLIILRPGDTLAWVYGDASRNPR